MCTSQRACNGHCRPQAEKTSRKAGLAERLVNGLAGENKRWSETIARMAEQEGRLVRFELALSGCLLLQPS